MRIFRVTCPVVLFLKTASSRYLIQQGELCPSVPAWGRLDGGPEKTVQGRDNLATGGACGI